MSRLNTLYQHAADVTADIKPVTQYGTVPVAQYDLVRNQGNGITSRTLVRSIEHLIYDNNLEKLCHGLLD